MNAAVANSLTMPPLPRVDTASSSDTPASELSGHTSAHPNVTGDAQSVQPNDDDNVQPISGHPSDLTPNAAVLNNPKAQPSISSNGSNESSGHRYVGSGPFASTNAGQRSLPVGRQEKLLASEDNLFEELKTTKSSSWQYEIRQLERSNRLLAEEVQNLIAAKKKRKRRKGTGNAQKDCANCHTRSTPEWRRGPSGQRDLCNSCGLRWAKLVSLQYIYTAPTYSC
jgi:hypothetical protein